MRRKNRKWVAIAVVLYLGVMWSAYRWAIAQRPTDGSLFEHIEREAERKALAEHEEEIRKQYAPPTGESRLNAAGPAFIAARYDQTHVVFMLATEAESRFSDSPLTHSAAPTKVSASTRPSAPLAGLQELWEPDSQSLHFLPKIVQAAHPGDLWFLSLSPEGTVPVAIERPVIAPIGCSIAIGFLASVPAEQQPAFAASARDYFAVHRTAVESASPPVHLPAGETLGEIALTLSPNATQQLEVLLKTQMKQEVAKIDAHLLANASSPGASASEIPVGDARPQLEEWLQADRGLLADKGKLDYDIRAFRLTPDGLPRLFVRARWKLADAPVFLMSAWFRVSQPSAPDSQIRLLSTDSSWSEAMRNGDSPATLGENLDFQTILNEFDADHDGWAELLIHAQDNDATTLGVSLYTDLGLIPLKTPLRRDSGSPEACIDR